VVKVGRKTVFKSSIKYETLNPVWNEIFELPISPGMSDDIKFVVLDHDSFKLNDFLGETQLSLSHIIKEEFSGWLQLESVEKGELHLEAEYLSPDVDDGESLKPIDRVYRWNREFTRDKISYIYIIELGRFT
jgi:Ca2+-dependent lipid-binding protein